MRWLDGRRSFSATCGRGPYLPFVRCRLDQSQIRCLQLPQLLIGHITLKDASRRLPFPNAATRLIENGTPRLAFSDTLEVVIHDLILSAALTHEWSPKA
jgi:hypothetical protein